MHNQIGFFAERLKQVHGAFHAGLGCQAAGIGHAAAASAGKTVLFGQQCAVAGFFYKSGTCVGDIHVPHIADRGGKAVDHRGTGAYHLGVDVRAQNLGFGYGNIACQGDRSGSACHGTGGDHQRLTVFRTDFNGFQSALCDSQRA